MDKFDLESNKINNVFSRGLDYIRQNYCISLGILFLLLFLLNFFIKAINLEYNGFILLVAFICFTTVSDINNRIRVRAFLFMSVPYLAFIIIIFANGNVIWHNVLRWELKRAIIINMNSFFNSIPFNDAAFTRVFHPGWLTSYMKVVYNTGFVLAVVVPLFRAALSIDFKKMLKYTLSAHVFQVFIITPFYMVFYLQEVWVVHGHADTLARHLNPAQTLETTLNCFPSMHTSIAFAMLLLVMRERSKIFKWVWGFYCVSIIYSTMYLEIHWVIDVIGGLILGYCTVKLVDFVLAKIEIPFRKRYEHIIFKNKNEFMIEK